MAHLNNIHNTEGYKIISGFENTFVCDKAIDANKTITFPDGWDNDTNLSFKVLFKNGHNCVDASTPMTLNGVEVVVNKYGTLIPLPIHEMDDSGTTKYKSLQANTILEMYYTDNYDGSDTPAYVVIGNPIVLSSTDYTIYADGYNSKDIYSTSEVKTNKVWIDGKTVYKKDFYFSGNAGGNHPHGITNVDTWIKASGVYHRDSATGGVRPLNGYSASGITYGASLYVDAINISIETIQVSAWNVIVNLEYTKTTD